MLPVPSTERARPEPTFALLVFLLTLASSAYVLLARQPLLFLGGLTDEWFPIGYNIAAYGTLGRGDQPILLRPPGYPAFIAGVLRLTTRVAPRPTAAYITVATDLVELAQAMLLAATAAMLFLWLRRRVGDQTAFAAGLLYGMNPYCLLLPGLMHYDVLHLFLLVAGCVALDRALAHPEGAVAPMLAAGAVWGLAALVRPVTAPLPLLVIAMTLIRGFGRRRALTATAAFTVAMLAVIAPWTARNYRVAGRLIPINVQGWAALWASTVMPLRMEPNEYQWYTVATAHWQPIYRRVTGEEYDYVGYIRHNVALEAAFKEEAIRNLREKPGVYARNVARSFLTMSLQINTALVSVFQRIQRTGETVIQPWFWAGAENERAPTRASRSTGALFGILTALAGVGIARGIRRRDTFLLVPGLVYLCIAAAHALTFFDFNYYYLRVPFVVVFAAIGADTLGRRGRWVLLVALVLALATSAVLALGF